jgi:hypothetical protein
VSTDDQNQMSIEDRVRTATRAGASLVRDIRPLGAPAPVRLRHRPGRAPRRWINWGIPLVAAAAVVAIALTLVAIRQPGTRSSPASLPATTTPATVPRYYAALDIDARGDLYTGPLIVGDDLTGKVVATIAPPPGLIFDSVRGSSDDRTFVIMAGSKAANGSAPFTWYLLRIFPGTAHPYQLIKLPIKPPASTTAFVYALSPDGQELAVESQSSVRTSSGWVTTLVIYSVASGAELHTWTMTMATAGSGPAESTLSWLSDGRQLAFSTVRSTSADILSLQLRTLDVTGSGTGLMTASRAVVTVPLSAASTCESLHLTPDGGTFVCATQYAFLTNGAGTDAGCANGGLQFIAYSVRTGKPVRVLYQYRGACHNGMDFLLWTDASASSIIGATSINLANEGGKQGTQLGVITDGHFRPLKMSKSVSPWDYGAAAF